MPWVPSGGGVLHPAELSSTTPALSATLALATRDSDVRKETCIASSFLSVSDYSVCHLPSLAMILAGRAYYDGVAKIGEIATGSPVSTELGELTVHYLST